jgi:hypothetical protein
VIKMLENDKKEAFKNKLEKQLNESDNTIGAYDDVSKFHVEESLLKQIQNLDEPNDNE